MSMHLHRAVAICATIFVLALCILLVLQERDTIHAHAALCARGTHVLYLGHPTVVTIVDTLESRQRGLSGVGALPPDEGMVFDFKSTGPQSFWMKDMLFSIDLVFFDRDWRIVKMFTALTPDTYPRTFDSTDDTSYALETSAGYIAREGLSTGTQARLETCGAPH